MRSRWTVFSAVALVAGLTGCAAVSAAPAPSPKPTVITLTQSATLDPPKGSKSAHLDIVCEGASDVMLTVDNEQASRLVECGSRRTMTVPVGETLVLEFDAQAGTTFTAKVLFSHASFHADAELAKQCTAASTALSDLADASNGLAESAISQQQAEGLMAQASVALQPASSAGVVGRQLEALRAWLINNPQADPRTAPGLGTGTITDLCVDNESPLIIVSSYGG